MERAVQTHDGRHQLPLIVSTIAGKHGLYKFSTTLSDIDYGLLLREHAKSPHKPNGRYRYKIPRTQFQIRFHNETGPKLADWFFKFLERPAPGSNEKVLIYSSSHACDPPHRGPCALLMAVRYQPKGDWELSIRDDPASFFHAPPGTQIRQPQPHDEPPDTFHKHRSLMPIASYDHAAAVRVGNDLYAGYAEIAQSVTHPNVFVAASDPRYHCINFVCFSQKETSNFAWRDIVETRRIFQELLTSDRLLGNMKLDIEQAPKSRVFTPNLDEKCIEIEITP
jgi:hypothetical protein